MPTVYLKGQPVTYEPKDLLGSGGEADVYGVGGKALKIFKGPNHPDFQGNALGKRTAAERLAIHQRKLPAFPRGLPGAVVAPDTLAQEKNGEIVGYDMEFLAGWEVLLRYAERSFRAQGITNDMMLEILLKLRAATVGVHQHQVVMGDYNNLNILVKGTDIRLVDADSYQFTAGGETFYCATFTKSYVDPLLCDPKQPIPVLHQSHNFNSDWYAFCVMVMECLLYVGPYGGIYKPADPRDRIVQDARPMKRITIFHPDVKYPRPATPFGVLPDDLLQLFHLVFEKDQRGEFPEQLLSGIRWTTCTGCGAEHARSKCPICAAPGAVKEVVTVRGTVTASRIFQTGGTILHAAVQEGKLKWVYNEGQGFRREDGTIFLGGGPVPGMKFRIRGYDTFIGMGPKLVHLIPGQQPYTMTVDVNGNLPTFDTNEKHLYWMQNGVLQRNSPSPLPIPPHYYGMGLQNQTYFWVGPDRGFGFYRASGLTVGFLFNAETGLLNDSVKLPSIRGQMLDCVASFGKDCVWFFVSTAEGGKTINQCFLIGADGKVLGHRSCEAGADDWLTGIRGHCAVGNFLLVATDEGVVRVEQDRSDLVVAKQFPDTEPWVSSKHHLHAASDGLYVVGERDIHLLKIA